MSFLRLPFALLIPSRFLAALIVTVLIGIAAPPAQAAGSCQPFPGGRYVTTVSHDHVVRYVDQALSGDWTRYMERHVRRIRQMDAIAKAGGTLTVQYKGAPVQISGQDLDRYVTVARKRLGILRCLSRLPDRSPVVEASAESLNNFATAAGGPVAVKRKMPSTPPASALAAATPGQERLTLRGRPDDPSTPSVEMAVAASCKGKDAYFRVVNLGPRFPAAGTITVYRLGAVKQVAKKRRILLSSKQSASFTVKGAAGTSQNLGLFIEPSWYYRPYTLDAAIACG